MKVVVAILALSTVLIVLKIVKRPEEVKSNLAKQDIATLMQALNHYHRDKGRYPTQAQGLHALIGKPNTDPLSNIGKEGGYLERLPEDPWGNAYQYLNPGVHGEIDVFSYGQDTRHGGEGDDADLGSWE
ncbi:type II secretion system major pseudopilin GspG [Paraburkholderia tagetis]|uniref:Type II secretion system major pseudopilin GspG n=1 Tax=Paraburkholderia tagetis TaxID=2913261 RepID=A0A9X1RL23_9BURK|nr:type II secretion system major pseudopilin GspG [Paraburkholderia tagetis]MCG5071832.1 type II secretion system major pseudopilin GspG [Paraburkholderia tagetis]